MKSVPFLYKACSPIFSVPLFSVILLPSYWLFSDINMLKFLLKNKQTNKQLLDSSFPCSFFSCVDEVLTTEMVLAPRFPMSDPILPGPLDTFLYLPDLSLVCDSVSNQGLCLKTLFSPSFCDAALSWSPTSLLSPGLLFLWPGRRLSKLVFLGARLSPFLSERSNAFLWTQPFSLLIHSPPPCRNGELSIKQIWSYYFPSQNQPLALHEQVQFLSEASATDSSSY